MLHDISTVNHISLTRIDTSIV